MRRMLFIAFFFEIGFALLVVPWSAFWDRNYFAEAVPPIHAFITNNFVRGAVSGLGLINIVAGLGEIIDRPVASYSGGQRRRLELARALLSDPQVLFLDEPTVGLDPLIRHELLDLIGSLRRRGEMTVVLTTHYLDEAERLCDRVAIIHAGRIVALDTPEALLGTLGSELLELRVDGDPAAALSVLMARDGLDPLMTKAVEAATKRSKELAS